MVKAMSTRCAARARQLGVGGDDVDRRDDHEEEAGLGEHPPDHAAPARCRRARARSMRCPKLRSSSMTATIAAPTATPSSSPSRLCANQSIECGRLPSARSWLAQAARNQAAACSLSCRVAALAVRGRWLAPPRALAVAREELEQSRPRRSTGTCGCAAAPSRPADRADPPSPLRSGRDGHRTCG